MSAHPNPPGGGQDPALVPVQHAATVMIVDDRPGLEVLLVQRTSRLVFGPGMWVFPGGRVDPGDRSQEMSEACLGLSDAEASERLEVQGGGLAWWVAAARETLEEAGILLAASANGDVVAPSERVVASIRQEVLANEAAFVDLLTANRIKLDTSLLEEVARFVTPIGPPRRFDTRFFVAQAPGSQQASHDHGEMVNHTWISPDDALAAWRSGDLEMMTPTVRMLACLNRYRSADAVLADAARRSPYQRVRVADPAGEYRVLLPGEPGYETADLEIESGWVRLWNPPETPIGVA